MGFHGKRHQHERLVEIQAVLRRPHRRSGRRCRRRGGSGSGSRAHRPQSASRRRRGSERSQPSLRGRLRRARGAVLLMLVGLQAGSHPAGGVPRVEICKSRSGGRVAEANIQNPVAGVQCGVASGERRGVADDKVAAPAGFSSLPLPRCRASNDAVEGRAVLSRDRANSCFRQNLRQLLDHKVVARDMEVAAKAPMERRQGAASALAVAEGAEAVRRGAILQPDGAQSRQAVNVRAKRSAKKAADRASPQHGAGSRLAEQAGAGHASGSRGGSGGDVRSGRCRRQACGQVAVQEQQKAQRSAEAAEALLDAANRASRKTRTQQPLRRRWRRRCRQGSSRVACRGGTRGRGSGGLSRASPRSPARWAEPRNVALSSR